MTVQVLSVDALHTHLDTLSDILISTVANGAAISFLHPVRIDQVRAFWLNEVAPEVRDNRRKLFAAMQAGHPVGTVQLITAMPPNQPHRAEVAKMMVHPSARRRGLARALITAALDHAQEIGKTLVTLDTRTGDAAQSLYASAGFIAAGIIPDFGVDPDGTSLHATTYMYKRI